jgi:hypothetical protein
MYNNIVVIPYNKLRTLAYNHHAFSLAAAMVKLQAWHVAIHFMKQGHIKGLSAAPRR